MKLTDLLLGEFDREAPRTRRALEQAAARETHMADVYWALAEIYFDDARRALETLRLTKNKSVTVPLPVFPTSTDAPEPTYTGYATGEGEHFKYELLSPSGSGPRVENVVAPFLPPELLNDRKPGRVVMDLQISETGEVGALWQISATPEIYSGLAISAVRDWKFDAVPGKIRVVFQFIP